MGVPLENIAFNSRRLIRNDLRGSSSLVYTVCESFLEIVSGILYLPKWCDSHPDLASTQASLALSERCRVHLSDKRAKKCAQTLPFMALPMIALMLIWTASRISGALVFQRSDLVTECPGSRMGGGIVVVRIVVTGCVEVV